MGNNGLHNTLEAATFGIPIVIGKNYQKFPEAKAMRSQGGLFSVATNDALDSILNELVNNPPQRKDIGQKNKDYIETNKGATELVMAKVKTIFKS